MTNITHSQWQTSHTISVISSFHKDKHHTQSMTNRAFRARERMSGNGLMIFQYLLFKSQIDRTHVGSTLRFYFQPVSHLSMSNSCNTDQTACGQAQNDKKHFSVCQTTNSENTQYFLQMKRYLWFYSFTCRHLETFYTVAKKVYTVSRSRLWVTCLILTQSLSSLFLCNFWGG